MRVLLLLCFCLAPVSAAWADSYMCYFSTEKYGDWFPPQFRIDYAPSSRDATLYDLSVPKDQRVPVAVHKSADNDRKAAFRLVLHNTVNTSGQHSAALRYFMTVKKKTGRANLQMKPQGYSNTLRAKGKCEPVGDV